MEYRKYKDNNKEVDTTKNNKTFINMNKANDECYTRKQEADKLVNYLVKNNAIDKNAKIWLPFNDNGSAIYHSLKENGFNNLIATESDFYVTKVDCDIIISNPPFAKRTKLFNKLMELGGAFILLQPVQFFNNSSCISLLCERSETFGFLCPTTRMCFIRNGEDKTTSTAFYSFWLCYKTKIKGFVKLPNLEKSND